MTDTIFGKYLFNFNMSPPLMWRGRGLWATLQPATRRLSCGPCSLIQSCRSFITVWRRGNPIKCERRACQSCHLMLFHLSYKVDWSSQVIQDLHSICFTLTTVSIDSTWGCFYSRHPFRRAEAHDSCITSNPYIIHFSHQMLHMILHLNMCGWSKWQRVFAA